MRNNLQTMMVLTAFVMGIGIIHSCKKKEQTTDTAADTDKELYEMAKVTSGFTWFKNSSTVLSRSAGSGHQQLFLKTRYNMIAATKLDSTGKIMSGATFPEGSLIVKELFGDSTTLERYAILYKNASSADADDKGWVWGYINADGSVAESATKKGISCISCHSQTDNIDYMLMNKYFP
ncbi:MAG: cytochrome P460 family protein [Flavobacteriales bacterium]|nr:cytochrome P460 family protein [Flavobacteriales bacterium]MCB9447099.1 cytochrome P460 family protein [Flavobacteriales bacterium]